MQGTAGISSKDVEDRVTTAEMRKEQACQEWQGMGTD